MSNNKKVPTEAATSDVDTHEINQVNSTTILSKMQAPDGIPPYRLSVMFKQASKIVNQLVNMPQWLVSYDDIEFILEIVLAAVQNARGERNER